jgi:chromosomal replication initiator protein
MELATEALAEALSPQQALTMDEIVTAVADFYHFDADDLRGSRRTKDLALARQVAMFLAREETDASLAQIGVTLGNRDHTTVMHGHDKVERQIEQDDHLRRDVLAIRGSLYNIRQP